MASTIQGASAVSRKLASYQAYLDKRLAVAVEEAARQMQRDLVMLAPARSGRLRAALASQDAIRIKGAGTANVRAEVGFITAEQKRQAFHAFFIEFGTKGYVRGQRRYAGKAKKSGRERWQKINRNIPARPAHPFFRPAFLALRRNLDRLRAEAHALALMDMMRGK